MSSDYSSPYKSAGINPRTATGLTKPKRKKIVCNLPGLKEIKKLREGNPRVCPMCCGMGYTLSAFSRKDKKIRKPCSCNNGKWRAKEKVVKDGR